MPFKFLLCLALFFPILSFAQTNQTNPAPAAHTHNAWCGADEAREKYFNENPAARAEYEAFELEVEKMIKVIEAEDAEAARNKTDKFEPLRTKYLIPVVVHVIHNGNPLSVAAVETQFPALFNDYRRIPGTPSWGGRGVDTQIEFSLATKDPDGNPSTGVDYVQNATWAQLSQSNGEENDMKNATKWPQNKYLNVWVVDQIIDGTGQNTVLGFAYFPGSNPNGDGAVIVKGCFGNRGAVVGFANRYGRTATHEFGHYLNLFHPFQGGCAGNSCQSAGDQVCDTPPTADQNFGKGNGRQNTCHNDNPDRADNPRNFMDYLDDEGMTFFSNGQRTRMHAVLRVANQTQRFPLWQDNNQFATGSGRYKKPEANFSTNNRIPCAGTPINFADYSMGMPNVFAWSFPGGTPSTSTDMTPEVVYSQAGTYDVTLIVSNASGRSDTITKTNYITVTDVVKTLPLQQSFDGTLWEGWEIANPDTGWFKAGQKNPLSDTWIRSSTVSFESGGGASAQMRNFSYAEYGQQDGLITPPIDLTNETSASFRFGLAYSPLLFDEGANQIFLTDSLRILVSKDCGTNWEQVYYKGGFELTTRDSFNIGTSQFKPEQFEWRVDSVDLTPYLGESHVRIKFENVNGWGNNLFIDEFVADNTQLTSRSGDKLPEVIGKFALLPNPTNSQTELQLNLTGSANIQLRVLDINGRLVSQQTANLAAGEHRLPISLDQQASGVYTVNALVNGQLVSRKLVKM